MAKQLYPSVDHEETLGRLHREHEQGVEILKANLHLQQVKAHANLQNKVAQRRAKFKSVVHHAQAKKQEERAASPFSSAPITPAATDTVAVSVARPSTSNASKAQQHWSALRKRHIINQTNLFGLSTNNNNNNNNNTLQHQHTSTPTPTANVT